MSGRQITAPAGSTTVAPVAGPTFEADARLADRFRVVRFVGHGGMGSVYEAWDEKLNRRVALKCAKGNYGGRLPPEARAASEVSHYNLCKVHDLHVVSTPKGEIDVLSMEFIEGETLAQCLDREGPLSPERARDVVTQICDGVGQAHRQGVVHGDLKTGNVLLGSSPDGALRAVITDFGLATLRVDPDSGQRGGTRDYMAPELLTGGRSTTASDMYALGVLIHVVLTGGVPVRSGFAWPQSARTSAETASTPDDARSMVPGWEVTVGKLPRAWKKAVAGCLATDPAQRLVSPADVTRLLRPRRRALTATAALVVMAIVATIFWRTSPAPAGPPVRLAVLPLTAGTDADAGGAPAASAGMATDVADRLNGRRRNFIVVPPAEVTRNRVDSAAMARTVFGASHVLVTHGRSTTDAMVLDATLIDLESGQTLRELSGTYPLADPPVVAKALVAMVTEAFRLPRTGPEESVTGPAAVPYSTGLALLRGGAPNSAAAAMTYFDKAAELAPTSALPYAGLAEAQLQRFVDDGGDWLGKAAATSEKARSLNADSVPVLLVLAGVAQQRGRDDDAIRELTRASELEPGNSEAWRRLALSYERTNPAAVVATFKRAIAEQPAYYRNHLSFGNYYMVSNQFDRAAELYRKVTLLVPGLASGHTYLGLALMQQGKFDDAERSLLTAQGLAESANLLVNLGALHYAKGEYEKALGYFQRSLKAGPPTVTRLADLGDAFRQLGQSQESDDAYRRGVLLAKRDVAVNARDANAQVFLGMLLARRGYEQEAELELSKAVGMAPDDASVLRQATIGYEALGQRKASLGILKKAPRSLLLELNRQPDVTSLRQDPEFQKLLANAPQ